MPSPPVLRGVHRRLALPPPPARPSLAVWRELAEADDDLAWALFTLSRRVRDVADAPPVGSARWRHAADVRAAAAGSPDIAADLLLLGAPALSLRGARSGRVAGACNRLAAWAAEQGFGEVAVQFAEAAVAIQPGNARRVYEAGRLNRMFGHLDDAEVLYSRAVTLARAEGQWPVYVRSHLGMGHIFMHRGDLARAAAHYRTAARCARDRSGERWLAAMIEHDLFAVAAERGEYEAAFSHAQHAFEWMPRHNERVPAFAHDYAYFLLETNAPHLALTLLHGLVRKRLPSAELVLIWSTLGRAGAMTGDVDLFHAAEEQVQNLAPRFQAFAASAHVNLGTAAHRLGLSAVAEAHALRSVELARAQGDIRIAGDAEVLLLAIQRGECAPALAATEPPERVRRFAVRILDRLSEWRGPTWRRKRQSGAARLGTV